MTGLGRTRSVALVGLEGRMVEVEAHLAASVPAFTLVGLPDAALSEARERVRAAVASSGVGWPQRRITVNLSPAGLPKAGPAFDLAIAVATLAAAGVCDAGSARAVVHLGELGLDGRLRGSRGVLPAVAAAVRAGCPRVVVPSVDAAEARLVPGAEVVGAETLAEVLRLHGADLVVPESASEPTAREVGTPTPQVPDLADVVGQDDARWALEVAAAGGHHVVMVGPPGAGKTMLAARLPGLLPDLDDDAAIEVTSVHSVSGTFRPSGGLLRRPPYEAPHHTATPAAVVGGGTGLPRPGAASRAHRGVLFLDEAPEFSPRVLQTLRQPLEHGELHIHRSAGAARFPARFQLVLAANPCPCGHGHGRGTACTCSSLERRRYLGRLSGPLLDRVDIQLDVRPVTRLAAAGPAGETTTAVAGRVAQARRRARERWAGAGWDTNAEVPGPWLRRHGSTVTADLQRALDRGTLTLRGVDRVLRLSWTLADLAGVERPGEDEVGQALLLRTRGQGAA